MQIQESPQILTAKRVNRLKQVEPWVVKMENNRNIIIFLAFNWKHIFYEYLP